MEPTTQKTETPDQAKGQRKTPGYIVEFRQAGEFYGRLHKALGFGDLTMKVDGDSVRYSWCFSSKRRQYVISRSYRFFHLMSEDISIEADYLAKTWRFSAKAELK